MTNNLSSAVQFTESPPKSVTIPSAATASAGMAGLAERGPVDVQVTCQGFDEWQRNFGSYTVWNQDTILAVKGFFDNGGTELHFVRVVHHTDATNPETKTSVTASLTLDTAAEAPTHGKVSAGNVGPYALSPGQTLNVEIDGGGVQDFTFTGTAGFALAADAAPYDLTDGWTLQGTVDGGHAWAVTFHAAEFANIAAATAAEVVAVLNAYFASAQIPASATVVGNAVKIISDSQGSASAVAVTGGTAAGAFGFASTAGTGNVPNIAQVTATQAATVLAGLTGATATNVDGALVITSATTGASSSVQVVAGSTTASEFGYDNAVHAGSSGAAVATLTVEGNGDGAYANVLSTVIAAATSGQSDHFNLSVLQNGIQIELWPNLSMAQGASDYCVTVINDPNTGSQYIRLTDELADVASPGNLPAAGTFGPLVGGNDGLVSLADSDYIGGEGSNGDVGLRCLDGVGNLSLLVVPGRATPAVQNAMITYCEITRGGLVFAILDPPKNQTAEQIVDYWTNTSGLAGLSERDAMYWPNILVANPSPAVYGSSTTLVAPPSGAIAGMFARVDASSPAGPFIHPAGIDFAQLYGALGLEMAEVKKKAKRDLVFPALVNPIWADVGQPIFVDGARCGKSDGNWPTVGERRGIIFVEASGEQGLQPIRQKNINPRLFNEARKASYKFLLGLTKAGAFLYDDPTKAFSVDFGPGLNTPVTQQARQVLGKWSIATSPPAEYVTIDVSPDTRALDAALAAAAQTTG